MHWDSKAYAQTCNAFNIVHGASNEVRRRCDYLNESVKDRNKRPHHHACFPTDGSLNGAQVNLEVSVDSDMNDSQSKKFCCLSERHMCMTANDDLGLPNATLEGPVPVG